MVLRGYHCSKSKSPSALNMSSAWAEEPGRLRSMGSQRVRHDWVTNTLQGLKRSQMNVIRIFLHVFLLQLFILKIWKCTANCKYMRMPLMLAVFSHLVVFNSFYNPMDCNLPGSSVHGDSPGKNTRVGCHALLQGIFLTQDRTTFPAMSPALLGRFFTTKPLEKIQIGNRVSIHSGYLALRSD